jgi:hypothetical protein
MRAIIRTVPIILACAMLAACGGGGSAKASSAGPTTTPAPAKTVYITSPPITYTVTNTVTVTVHPVITKTVKVTPVPVSAISEGVWLVGSDIKAGTYRTIDPVMGDCYWEIGKPGTTAIIDNDIVTGGRPTVVLRSGQQFTTRDCGDWARA